MTERKADAGVRHEMVAKAGASASFAGAWLACDWLGLQLLSKAPRSSKFTSTALPEPSYLHSLIDLVIRFLVRCTSRQPRCHRGCRAVASTSSRFALLLTVPLRQFPPVRHHGCISLRTLAISFSRSVRIFANHSVRFRAVLISLATIIKSAAVVEQ